jgi:hypothetical protein
MAVLDCNNRNDTASWNNRLFLRWMASDRFANINPTLFKKRNSKDSTNHVRHVCSVVATVDSTNDESWTWLIPGMNTDTGTPMRPAMDRVQYTIMSIVSFAAAAWGPLVTMRSG